MWSLIPFSLVVIKIFRESYRRKFQVWHWSQLFPLECWLIFTRIYGVPSQEPNAHLYVLYQYAHKTVRHSSAWVITRHSHTELMSIIYKHRHSVILLRPMRSSSVKWNVVHWFRGQMVHFSLLSRVSLRKYTVNRYSSLHLYPIVRQTFRMTVNQQSGSITWSSWVQTPPWEWHNLANKCWHCVLKSATTTAINSLSNSFFTAQFITDHK